MSFKLPNLPYDHTALEPFMSKQTLELHHGKHHQTYVNNLNNLVEGTELADASLEDIMLNSSKDSGKQAIFNNAGQHWNHKFFWQNMQANGGGKIPGSIEQRLISDFGSVEAFKESFVKSGAARFGSGWVWLIEDEGKLTITTTANAYNPYVLGKKVLIACDVWEHSYYLDYQNTSLISFENFLKILESRRVIK